MLEGDVALIERALDEAWPLVARAFGKLSEQWPPRGMTAREAVRETLRVLYAKDWYLVPPEAWR